MIPTPRERQAGYLCVFAMMFIWTGFIISGRAGSRTGLPPWDMGLLRYAGSLLAALPFMLRHGLPRVSLRQAAVILVTACFGFGLLAYAAFSLAPASHGAVLIPGGLPFVSALVMWLAFGDRFTARRCIALGLIAAGIALLAWDTFGATPGAWRGDLLFLAAIASFAIYMVAVRHWRIGARDATLAMCLYALPVYLPVWLLLPTRIHEAPPLAVAWQFVMQGALAVLAANYLFTRAMNVLGPATLTTCTALVPGMAAFGAWALLGEPIGAVGLVGIAVVSVATVLAVTGRPAADPRVARGPAPS